MKKLTCKTQTRIRGALSAALALTACAAQSQDDVQATTPVTTPPSALVEAGAPSQRTDNGMLFGSVEMDDGRVLTGSLRWGEQEVAWIHHFNGDKARPFDLSELNDNDRKTIEQNLPGPRFEVNGHVIELVSWLGSSELQAQFFSMEFGHIAELEPTGNDRVTLTLRDGTQLKAHGGSDDIGADIEIMTSQGQIEELDWDDIEKVRFHAPETAPPGFPAYLYGQVETRSGVFKGFVDWDQDERYPEDELDGDVDGNEQSIRFSSILSIENQGESSLVALNDGRILSMSDTNDVNSENRGIVLYMADLGKVVVPWSSFKKVTYTQPPNNLPAYADFADFGSINARVKANTEQAEGNLVYDLDHQHQSEMLRGKDSSGLQFEIPWRLIQKLTPDGNNTVQVALKDGRMLNLGKDPDVTGSNLGIALKMSDDSVKFLAWETVRAIEVTN